MTELSTALILAKTKVMELAQVKNLNLWGSELGDISAVKDLTSLEVLALSVNHVTTLKDVAACRSLRELYLRKNDVADLAEVYHLSKLQHLTVLWLIDNPCATHPLYRSFTIRCCPALKQFDNVEVTPQERAQADRLTKAEMESVLKGAAPRTSTPPPEPKAEGPRRAQAPLLPEPQAQPPAPHQQAPPAPQPAASGHHSSRQTQKHILSAIMTLLTELNPESLQFLQAEVGDQLQKRRASHCP